MFYIGNYTIYNQERGTLAVSDLGLDNIFGENKLNPFNRACIKAHNVILTVKLDGFLLRVKTDFYFLVNVNKFGYLVLNNKYVKVDSFLLADSLREIENNIDLYIKTCKDLSKRRLL